MAEQLPLELPARTALDRGDFFVSDCNALAIAAIETWSTWPTRKHILCGPAGSGKTHLMHVWAQDAGAQLIPAISLPDADIETLAHSHVAVDDVPDIAGDRAAENALFHLHNLTLANGNSILLSGRSQPHLWGITLPDLASRLQGAGCSALTEPDDTLFMVLIAKLFSDRQLFPAPDVMQYLTTRLDRSYHAAQIAVTALDRAALSQQRSITRPLAAQVVEKLNQDKELP